VLTLVAEGYTNQQIANRLGVAERTARTHVSNILTKLGLTSRRRLRLE
jgi:DNA-binding NarL/FixJ family response regulator